MKKEKPKLPPQSRQATIDFLYKTSLLEKARKKASGKKQPKSKQKS